MSFKATNTLPKIWIINADYGLEKDPHTKTYYLRTFSPNQYKYTKVNQSHSKIKLESNSLSLVLVCFSRLLLIELKANAFETYPPVANDLKKHELNTSWTHSVKLVITCSSSFVRMSITWSLSVWSSIANVLAFNQQNFILVFACLHYLYSSVFFLIYGERLRAVANYYFLICLRECVVDIYLKKVNQRLSSTRQNSSYETFG